MLLEQSNQGTYMTFEDVKGHGIIQSYERKQTIAETQA
jgi:hypothetical protein